MNIFLYSALLAALILLGVMAVRSYFRTLSGGCCGGGGRAVRAKKAADRNPAHYPYTAVLTVDGMVCSSCANAVANALNALPGVWAAVDLGKKEAAVRMKKRLSPDELRQAVRAAGPYTVLKAEFPSP